MNIILLATITLTTFLAAAARQATDFVVYLWGANEVPPNDSPFKAQRLFSLDGDLMSYWVALLSPTFKPTDAGLYGPAGRGTNGDLILDWPTYSISLPAPSGGGGALIYAGGFNLTSEQISQLQAGLWYVSIKSASFPNGEIRGQVCPLAPECDCDFDGVPNSEDLCPQTAPGAVVDDDGCSIDELVPCNGPWRNHGEYVNEVKEEAFRFWKEGRITQNERRAIMHEAHESNGGNPHPPPRPGPIVPGVFPGPGVIPKGFFGPPISPR